MNKTITVPDSYIALVWETRIAQQAYFEAILKAKKTKLGSDFQAAKEQLREAKNLEATLDQQTDYYMTEIRGKMTADEAIAAMRAQLDEDLDVTRKETSNSSA